MHEIVQASDCFWANSLNIVAGRGEHGGVLGRFKQEGGDRGPEDFKGGTDQNGRQSGNRTNCWLGINSFVGLAKRDSSILVAKTRTSSGMLLLDRLVDLVVQTSASSSCLTSVRALVHFYHHSLKQEEDRQEEIRKEQALTFPILQHQGALVQKLKELLTGDGLHRLRAYSAYLLHLMGKLDPPCYALIEAIDPTHDRPHHWLDFEQSMLGLLIQVYHLHLPSSSWPIEQKYIRPDYKHPHVSFICNCVLVPPS